MRKLVILLIAFMLSSLLIKAQETGTFTDSRDNKVYKTVKIGNQWFMSENLAYKPNSGNYWAYNNQQNNVTKYGYLYDWETAKKVAKGIKGWHLPTNNDWNALIKYLGNDKQIVCRKLISSGKSGFNALLSGYYDLNGTFNLIGDCEGFWSETEYGDKGGWALGCLFGLQCDLYCYHRDCGYSVRLLKD